MKSGGGMKRHHSPVGERVGYSPTGRLQVSSPEHMERLHKSPAVMPLRLGLPVALTGVSHLHHTGNRDKSDRKHDDSATVLIDSAEHDYLHQHAEAERLLLPTFGAWQGLHWWASRTGNLDRPDVGQHFLAWVVETLESQRQNQKPL